MRVAIGPEQRAELLPAEETEFASPIPTQIVSSDEYLPARQTQKQREVEARLKDLGAVLANRQGMSRRRFFQTAAGMAASYLVMNQVYGRLFTVSEAEAATPAMAEERAAALKTQTIFDAHTHFLRDDPSPTLSNPARPGSLMWQRALVTRLGWNKDLAGREPTIDDLKFDSFFKQDEHAAVGDVGRAAKDWPQLNFVIYHSGYRHLGGAPAEGMDEWEQRDRLSWLSDLAEIPAKHDVTNVYGDLGSIFAWTVIAQPRLAAAMLGTLIKGLGTDHVIWGTDCVWTGSPQWQIEALRRLEIPEDMQKRHGFAPLGPADGLVKNAILGENGLRIFGYKKQTELGRPDRLADIKIQYELIGPARSNLRYGYVHKARA